MANLGSRYTKGLPDAKITTRTLISKDKIPSRSSRHWNWPLRKLTSCNVALPEQTNLILSKCPDHGVDQPPVVEEHKVSLLPVVGIHQLGSDAWALKLVHTLTNLLEVIDDCAIGEVKLADGRGVDLECQLPRHGVAPAHGEDLNLVLLDSWQILEGDFHSLRDQAQTVGARLGAAHPDVWMRCVLDLGGADKLLIFGRESVVHGVARHKGSGAEGDSQLVIGAVVVQQRLLTSPGDTDCEQRRHHGRGESVQSGVNVPPVEAGKVKVLLGGDDGGVKGLVVGMPQLDVPQTLVVLDEAVADDLDLGLMRDRLEVRVEDGPLGVQRLAVAVRARGLGVESLGDLVLRPGGDVALVPEDEDLVGEQGLTDDVKVGICGNVSACLCVVLRADALPREVTDFTGILPLFGGLQLMTKVGGSFSCLTSDVFHVNI